MLPSAPSSSSSSSSSFPLFLVLLLLLLSLTTVSHCFSRDSSSAYDVLESYGFPSGLLPETVASYELDDDGKFTLYLDGSCTVDIPNAYPVKYASTIKGNIASGSLTNLSGISVKVFFIWWDITAIYVSGENLVFKVGPASATYPILNFSENPVCEGSFGNPVAQVS